MVAGRDIGHGAYVPSVWPWWLGLVFAAMTIVFSVHGWLFIRFQPGFFVNYKGKRIYNQEETGLIVFCGPPIFGLFDAPATINIGLGIGPCAIPSSVREWPRTPFWSFHVIPGGCLSHLKLVI